MSYLSYNPNAQQGGSNQFFFLMIVMLLALIALPYLSGRGPQSQTEQGQPSAPEQRAEPANAAAASPSTDLPLESRKLQGKDFEISLTNDGGGRIESLLIQEPARYLIHGDVIRSQKEGKASFSEFLPLAMSLPKLGLSSQTRFSFLNAAPNQLALVHEDAEAGYRIVKTFKPGETAYTLEAEVNISNLQDKAIEDQLSLGLFIKQIEGEEPSLFKPGALVAAKCYSDGDMEYLDSSDKEEKESYQKDIEWIAVDESYFAIAVQSGQITSCDIRNREGLLSSEMSIPVSLPAKGSLSLQFKIFVGPKEAKYLDAFGHELPSVIDYGWIEILARPMAWILDIFYQWTHNWGLAIILLTIIVRLLLWPVATKSQLSMMGMAKIAPLMKELQEKYKDDPATLQQKQLELYREHKVNPFGCLPLLLQMPVFFALYRCIFVTGGLYNAPFALWIKDLSAPDPFFVLPILATALILVQQILSPTTIQSKQQKIMLYSMPVIFGAMMLFLPSGLCLYMVMSSAISGFQSFYIRKRYGDKTPVIAGAEGDVIDVEAVSAQTSKARRANKRRNQH